ncbi:MAG: hypothetical protein ABIH23_24510, partial [bacterium]
VCEVIGAREAQETDTWRALLAVLVPLLLCCCCVAVIGILYGFLNIHSLQADTAVLPWNVP